MGFIPGMLAAARSRSAAQWAHAKTATELPPRRRVWFAVRAAGTVKHGAVLTQPTACGRLGEALSGRAAAGSC